MDHNTSRKVTTSSTSQEITRIKSNSKVHCRTDNSPSHIPNPKSD